MSNAVWALVIIAGAPAFVALAVAGDRRSRRSYGLGLLAIGALVLILWGSSALDQATQLANASQGDDLETVAWLMVSFVSGLYVTLALTLGAIVEILIARQWWWLGIIVTLSVVPAVIIVRSPAMLVPDTLGAWGLPRESALVVMLLIPVLVTFAYALVYSIRRPLAR